MRGNTEQERCERGGQHADGAAGTVDVGVAGPEIHERRAAVVVFEVEAEFGVAQGWNRFADG